MAGRWGIDLEGGLVQRPHRPLLRRDIVGAPVLQHKPPRVRSLGVGCTRPYRKPESRPFFDPFPFRRLRVALVVATIVSLAAASAAAETSEPSTPIAGEFSFTEVQAGGWLAGTFVSPGALGFGSGQEDGLDLTWAMSADKLVVNWTRVHAIGVGDSSSDPSGSFYSHRTETSYGNHTYFIANSTAHLADAWASSVAVLDELTSASVEPFGSMKLRAAQEDDVWFVGMRTNQSVNGRTHDPLTAVYKPTNGFPLSQFGKGSGAFAGDATIYVWGGNLTVMADGESRNYRAGVWWENATVPTISSKGLVRDEYRQLLRVELHNATVSFKHEAGAASLSAPAIDVDVLGSLEFSNAHGIVESPEHEYRLDGESMAISGNLTSSIAVGPDVSSVFAQVAGAAEVISASPTAPIHQAGPVNPEGAGTVASDPLDSEASGLLWVAPAAMLLGGAAAMVVVARGKTVRGRRMDPVLAAEHALLRGLGGRAAKWSLRRLEAAPDDPDALFLYGASLLQQGAVDRLIGDVEPRLDSVRPLAARRAISLLVGLAYLRKHDTDRAIPLLEQAAKDPALARRILTDQAFAELQSSRRFQRIAARIRSGNENVAYV